MPRKMSPPGVEPDASPASRFNEAAASMPRKIPSVMPCATPTRLPRFNEAAASMPRKMQKRNDERNNRGGIHASMRPRHRCRGRSRAHHQDEGAWNTSRFNEAAASMPRKIYCGADLQACRVIGASMRPRHRCRGRSSNRMMEQHVRC